MIITEEKKEELEVLANTLITMRTILGLSRTEKEALEAAYEFIMESINEE